ncbi:hypothetical protein Dsin_021379 [Dipteronia sinensis]|uniref:Uncharacterized protein n=1 Tax=Dipteronia sinensis TaxID=43782 RepID=A0AAE0DZ19_9ROSI|nr:hypothetical protein Dsin_021379 [Dipteronia sinensis]
MLGRRDGSAEDSICAATDFLETLKRQRKTEVVGESDGSGFRVSNGDFLEKWWCFFPCKADDLERSSEDSSLDWIFT